MYYVSIQINKKYASILKLNLYSVQTKSVIKIIYCFFFLTFKNIIELVVIQNYLINYDSHNQTIDTIFIMGYFIAFD
jgi:hypothetical protein